MVKDEKLYFFESMTADGYVDFTEDSFRREGIDVDGSPTKMFWEGDYIYAIFKGKIKIVDYRRSSVVTTVKIDCVDQVSVRYHKVLVLNKELTHANFL